MSFLAKAARLLDVAKRQLGETVLYRHKGGGRVEIKAVWNNLFEIVDSDAETLVTANQPHIGVILKDLIDAPQQGDRVEFMGKQWKVVDIQEDGQGAAQLFLYKI